MALNAKNDVRESVYSSATQSQNVQMSREQWCDSVLQRMTTKEKIAQLFVIWTKAGYIPDDSKQWQEKIRFAKEIGVGGFYFSHGTAYGFAVNANKLQSVAKIPLLLSADFEWGTGMRISEATTFPRAMAHAATRDTNLSYTMGKAVAREARAIGIRQVYSPDVDINNNPKNPV
ncbi:MAG: glycoside hydrolase family 3 N-terminal domain-containing protein, partial [Bacteroidota bacterium]